MVPEEDVLAQVPRMEGPGLDPRRVVFVGAGLFAAFGGLALWALHFEEAETPTAVAPKVEIRAKSTTQDEIPTTQHPPPPVALRGLLAQGHLLEKPRNLFGLLARQFQRTRPDGSSTFTALRNILPIARGVTIVNVWATYCEPCKREFPGFSALQNGWGPNVRFVPIQLGEGEASQLNAIMPEAPDRLTDYTPGGAVQSELARLGLLPANAPIPITMILDCHQDLRWMQQGEVTDMRAFDDAVKLLRDELRTQRCATKTQPIEPDPTPAISEDNCRKPKCTESQICTQRISDGTYHCLDDLR